METMNDTGVKADLRASRILCGALIAGVTVFAIIALVVVRFISGPTMDPGTIASVGDIFLAVCGGSALLCFFIAHRNYKKAIIPVQARDTLTEKLTAYRDVLIRFMALSEVSAIFGIICFFMTGIYYCLIVSALMIGVMLWKAPFGKKYVAELNLDWNEQQQFL